MEETAEGRKVEVFAVYQIGPGIKAKIIGDADKSSFEVTLASTSAMVREVEEILEARHKDEVKEILRNRRAGGGVEQGPVIVIIHFHLHSSF